MQGLVLGAAGPGRALPADVDSSLVYTAWRTVGVRDGLPHDSIRAIRVLDDQVWVGTDGGLARLDAGGWKAWTSKDGLPPYPISAIDMDPDTRDLWLGTWGGGLVRFTAGRADNFNQFNSGLAGDLVFAVVVADGQVWAATNGGVSVFDPFADSWELHHPRRADDRETAVTDLVYDDGALSTVLRQIGMRRFDFEPLWVSSTTRTVWGRSERAPDKGDSGPRPAGRSPPPSGPPGGYVQCLALGPGGSLWVGADDGLHVLADRSSNQWITYRSEREGRAGVIAVSRGDVKLAEVRDIPVLPDNNVRCLAFGGGGVWVGTAHGLAHGGKAVSLTPADGSPTHGPRREASDGGAGAESVARLLPPGRSTDPSEPLAIAVYGPRNRPITLPGRPAPGDDRSDGPDPFTIEMIVERAVLLAKGQPSRPLEFESIKPTYRRYGWGLPEDDMIVFSQNPRVLGIIGAIGGEQLITDAAAARTEIPWINVAPDVGLRETQTGDFGAASNPWVFRCWGDLPRQHRILLGHVFDRFGCSRPAVLRTPDGGLHLDWWIDYARSRGRPPVADLEWNSDATDPETIWEPLRRANADALLTWCDKQTAAKMLRSMRKAGMQQWFVGGPAIVAEDFLTLVGSDPGPVIALVPQDSPAGDAADDVFRRDYATRTILRGIDALPDARAFHSWAATEHLMDAFRRSAPDRVSVRRTLDEMSRSASGEGHYERLHVQGRATVARLEGGRWVSRTIGDSPGD